MCDNNPKYNIICKPSDFIPCYDVSGSGGLCASVKCHPVCAGFFCPETLTGERRRPPVDDHSYTNFLRNQPITIPPISSHRIQPKCLKWPAILRGTYYMVSLMFARWMCCADKSKIWPDSWEVVTMGQSCSCDLQRWVWPSAPLASWLFPISEQSHPAVAEHAADARGLEMPSMASAIRPGLHVGSSVCLLREDK